MKTYKYASIIGMTLGHKTLGMLLFWNRGSRIGLAVRRRFCVASFIGRSRSQHKIKLGVVGKTYGIDRLTFVVPTKNVVEFFRNYNLYVEN